MSERSSVGFCWSRKLPLFSNLMKQFLSHCSSFGWSFPPVFLPSAVNSCSCITAAVNANKSQNLEIPAPACVFLPSCWFVSKLPLQKCRSFTLKIHSSLSKPQHVPVPLQRAECPTYCTGNGFFTTFISPTKGIFLLSVIPVMQSEALHKQPANCIVLISTPTNC